MKHFISYGTGAGNEWICGDLFDAVRAAISGASYTQEDINIYDENHNLEATSHWYGVSIDPDDWSDKLQPVADFGSFGYFEPFATPDGMYVTPDGYFQF